MAGGEGAKERRRLKRLAAQGGGGNANTKTETKKSLPVKRNDARTKPMAKHQFAKKSFAPKPVGRFQKHSPKNGAPSKFQNTKKKKNKPKKPKHLKRKLEQLGEAEADRNIRTERGEKP